jgi:hypothetical protein
LSLHKWLAVLACSISLCVAQTDTNKPSEPESIGVFFYLEPATQALKELPKEEYKRHRGAGWATVTDSVKVSGPVSTFHITGNDKATFVFKATGEAAQKAQLHPFTVKDGWREYEIGKWKRRDFLPSLGLPLTLAQFGSSSYKVTTQAPLEPGEYALTMGPSVYTFSVSAPASSPSSASNPANAPAK